jgi:hypothetical protein
MGGFTPDILLSDEERREKREGGGGGGETWREWEERGGLEGG